MLGAKTADAILDHFIKIHDEQKKFSLRVRLLDETDRKYGI